MSLYLEETSLFENLTDPIEHQSFADWFVHECPNFLVFGYKSDEYEITFQTIDSKVSFISSDAVL